MNNRSMPRSPVIPVLHYTDVAAATAWLTRAFGFAERLRIGTHRVQLDVFGGAAVAADGAAAAAAPARTHSVMVRVPDVDALHAQALRAGATIAQPPTTYPFGERQFTAIDPGGHAWTFSQTVADVDPASWGGVLVATKTDRA